MWSSAGGSAAQQMWPPPLGRADREGPRSPRVSVDRRGPRLVPPRAASLHPGAANSEMERRHESPGRRRGAERLGLWRPRLHTPRGPGTEFSRAQVARALR